MDRGAYSRHVIEAVMDLVKNKSTIAIRGNHDQMFLDAMLRDEDSIFLHNGGLKAIESFCGTDWLVNGFDYEAYEDCKQFIKAKYAHVIDFLSELPYYYEDESHIFVHAGLNPFYDDWSWKSQDPEYFLWIRELFLNNESPYSKTIVHGHTPTVTINGKPDVIIGNGKINIDGGCCFKTGYKLNCLIINEDGSYDVDFVTRGEV